MNIGIIGLGLIGGSLARSIRSHTQHTVWGYDIDPATMLRAEGDLFLCGMTPAELSQKLGVPVRPVRGDGAELLAAMLGVECPY